jgi:hypothetical protein
MNNGPKIGTGQTAVAKRNEPDSGLEMAPDRTGLTGRGAMPMEWHEWATPTPDDWQLKREHIASLEFIIAILIEKNERMRRRLALYID